MSHPNDPAQPGFDARRFKATERAGLTVLPRVTRKAPTCAPISLKSPARCRRVSSRSARARPRQRSRPVCRLAAPASSPAAACSPPTSPRGMLAEGARRCGEHADTPASCRRRRRTPVPRRCLHGLRARWPALSSSCTPSARAFVETKMRSCPAWVVLSVWARARPCR